MENRRTLNKGLGWYAVKCLFHHPTRAKEGESYLFEERITLWNVCSFEESYVKAREEAEAYAADENAIFVGSTDSFWLFDMAISSGVEIYSLMRGSNLMPEVYRDTFCVTSRDRLFYESPP